MKTIAICATSQRGKTPTLQLLYKKIRPVELKSDFYEDLGNGDFFDMFEYKGKKVGIVSQGDYATGTLSLSGYLERLNKCGSDIVVCACRTKGGTKDAVLEYPGSIILKKEVVINGSKENELAANLRDVERMLEIINKMV